MHRLVKLIHSPKHAKPVLPIILSRGLLEAAPDAPGLSARLVWRTSPIRCLLKARGAGLKFNYDGLEPTQGEPLCVDGFLYPCCVEGCFLWHGIQHPWGSLPQLWARWGAKAVGHWVTWYGRHSSNIEPSTETLTVDKARQREFCDRGQGTTTMRRFGHKLHKVWGVFDRYLCMDQNVTSWWFWRILIKPIPGTSGAALHH